jgi:hypothetical protein
MNAEDIIILVIVALAVLFVAKGGSKDKIENAEKATDDKDAALKAELKPVPTIDAGPAPVATPFTPGEATSYWNKELNGEEK